MPSTGDLRYNWVVSRLAALDVEELEKIALDAWRIVVPTKVAWDHLVGFDQRGATG